MYPTDPSLYGATLPQKEFSIPTPFMHPFFAGAQPVQGIPWQGFQGQSLPWQWQNLQPWQNVQRYVPPFYAQGVLPHYAQSFGYPTPYQSFGYSTPYMTASYSPMGFNPYIQAGFPNMPLSAWQRCCY